MSPTDEDRDDLHAIVDALVSLVTARVERQRPPNPLRKALSTADAAAALGLTEQMVGRLLRAGKLRGVKANSVWIVPLDALDEFIARKDET
jgi:hypothetical protein